MSLKKLLLPLLFATTSVGNAADTVTEYLLHTVDSKEGGWPCLYYELNYNTDIAQAERAKWYGRDEDETYWREGLGPFSIDGEKFLVTHWQSTVHPILIRRHFTLTADDLAKIAIGTVTLTYSYDENPKFWLNGTQLATATGWNDNNYATYQLASPKKRLLVEGDNLLCVSLQQGSGGGHIDYGLTVKYDPMHTDIILTPEEEENNTAYNLLGQKISHTSKYQGIIISNGKKILHKK